MPPYFDWQTEDVTCCRKICAASADRCTNRESCHSVSSCLIVWMLMKTFWKISKQVMKLGCAAMMMKQKFPHHSEWENWHHDQKRHVRVALMWRWWQYFVFLLEGYHSLWVCFMWWAVSNEFYLNVLKHLREAVCRKRPEAWTNNTWMLHHDNAPAHASLLTFCPTQLCVFNFKNSWVFQF